MRLESLRDSRLPVVLFVSHAFGGGVARHITDLARGISGHAMALRLEPHGERHVVLRTDVPGDTPLWFGAESEMESLVSLLRGIGIDRVHFHHVHGLPPEVLDLPDQCECPHTLTLHDHFPACPAYHMKDASLRYCGGSAGCGKCLEAAGSSWGWPIAKWRERFGALLASAERVIAPSQSAADAMRRFFPAVTPAVWPHPEDTDVAVPARVRVLVPGAISVEKGLDVLAACLRDAQSRELPLHFHVMGFLGRALPLWPAAPLTVSGQYAEGDLPRLLAMEKGDVAFFPAQCPETFSYTLSATLATGIPIVATDLGALPERLAGRPDSRIIPWSASASEFNDALLAVAAPRAVSQHARPRSSMEQYCARYLAGLRRSPARGALPVVDPRWHIEPPLHAPLSTMQWLFEDGVLAGKAASFNELERRVGEADVQLAQLGAALSDGRRRTDVAESSMREAQAAAESERAQRHLQEKRLASAEYELDRMTKSRSWRITAPLRRLVRLITGG